MPPGAVRAQVAAETLRVLRPGGRVLVYDLRLSRPGGDGHAIPRGEVARLFPGTHVVSRTTGLLPPLLRVLLGTFGERFGGRLARGLSALPFLRSHRVVVVRRDPPPPAGLPRALDAAVAAVTLLGASPVLAICAIAVSATSRGGVLHRAVRSGRYGVPFTILKFRTMRVGLAGPGITGGGDPRVTPVGRLLRALHLDELPQLWNVLRGDMALVGPRPEDVRFADLRDLRWRRILSVRPGITGWSQLTFSPYEHERLRGVAPGDVERIYREEILPAKLASEVRAVDTRSAWSDLRCLARTPLRVLSAWFRGHDAVPAGVPGAHAGAQRTARPGAVREPSSDVADSALAEGTSAGPSTGPSGEGGP
jgi:lipopolysaccharide/colanic/teichoic acid biosynthesis glycosyltransferase